MPDTRLAPAPTHAPIGGDAAVLAEVTDVVRQVLEDRTIELHAAMPVGDLTGWDSMNHVAILVELECRFDVLFELDDLAAVPTVGHLVQMIQAKRSVPGRLSG